MQKIEMTEERRKEYSDYLKIPYSANNQYHELIFDPHPDDPDLKPTKMIICLGEHGMHFRKHGYYSQNFWNEGLGITENKSGNMDFMGSIIRSSIKFMAVRLVESPDAKEKNYALDFYYDGGSLSINPLTESIAFELRNIIWAWRIIQPLPQLFFTGLNFGQNLPDNSPQTDEKSGENTPT